MQIALTLLAALAPAFFLVRMILAKDKTQPEPPKWIVISVAAGVLSVIIVIIFGILFIPDIEVTSMFTGFLNAFVGAAIPEECCKFLMLYWIANRCKHFDEMFDGIVYAVCVGMGFAGFENILYLFQADSWVAVGIARALLSVPGHYFFAVLMGTFFALGYFDAKNRKLYYGMALLWPIVAHGVYDGLLMSSGVSEAFGVGLLLLFFMGMTWIRKATKQFVNHMLIADGVTE